MNWRKKLSFGVVIWVSLWVIFELALRLFGYGRYVIYVPDSELLWLPSPNQQSVTVAGHKEITMNAQGLRYKTDLEKRNPHQHRIVAFGDSVTMGWGVGDSSHYCAVLERRLDELPAEGSFQVVSAGVNAYPMSLCTRRFERMLSQGYQIDTAILAYSFNTGFEPLARLEGKDREKMLRRVQLKSIVRRFAVYNLVIEDWLRDAVYYRIRERLVAGSWETGQKPLADLMVDYQSDLESMKNAAEQNGVRLVFLLLGSNGQRNDLNEHQTAFLQFAQRHDIPIVNMISRLNSVDQRDLFMDHVHPNEIGHSLIAASLMRPIAN